MNRFKVKFLEIRDITQPSYFSNTGHYKATIQVSDGNVTKVIRHDIYKTLNTEFLKIDFELAEHFAVEQFLKEVAGDLQGYNLLKEFKLDEEHDHEYSV
jgi:hypothetical protein